MRCLMTLIATTFATGAQAHVGHIADVAGHDHWVVGAAIGVIVIAGVLGALKGKEDDENDIVEDAEGEPA